MLALVNDLLLFDILDGSSIYNSLGTDRFIVVLLNNALVEYILLMHDSLI